MIRGRSAGAPRPDAHGLEFERVLFFSDAVFAIAITLLVIELRLPALAERASNDDVAAALRELGPKLFAFVLSFTIVGLYWLAHWRRFQHIERTDGRLAVLNLVLLGLVAFIPFPTAVIGEHGDTVVAVVLYAVTLAAAGLAGTGTWWYAWRAGLTRSGLSREHLRWVALRGLTVPIVMLGSLLLLPVLGPYGVEVSWLLIVPLQGVTAQRAEAAG